MSRPIVLALETSGPVGSVALAIDSRVVGRRTLRERNRHAGAVPTAIEDLLVEAAVAPTDVGGVAVGMGPGSFTGVRVAAAAANGFAHAVGCGVWPVSSLAAAAVGEHAPAWPDAGPLRVAFDARGDRLFTAVYEWGPGRLETLESPRFAVLDQVLAAPGARRICGSGAIRHRDVLLGAGLDVLEAPAGTPTAGGVLTVLGLDDDAEPVAPGAWAPAYLRDTGAVRARTGGGP